MEKSHDLQAIQRTSWLCFLGFHACHCSDNKSPREIELEKQVEKLNNDLDFEREEILKAFSVIRSLREKCHCPKE